MKTYLRKKFGFWKQDNIPDSYLVGSTLNDFNAGLDIERNADQLAFRAEHPEASPLEVFTLELEPAAEVYRPDRETMISSLCYDIDQSINSKIEHDHSWNDMPILLPEEKISRYKMLFDLAIQLNGKRESLPVQFTFGTFENPVYYTFSDLANFTDFYCSVISHIEELNRLRDEQYIQVYSLSDQELFELYNAKLN